MKRAVANHVELEPERLLVAACDFLDRACRHGRQTERHAGCFGRPRRLHFAAPRIQPGESDRAERDGQRRASGRTAWY